MITYKTHSNNVCLTRDAHPRSAYCWAPSATLAQQYAELGWGYRCFIKLHVAANIYPTLAQCWATVADGAPTLGERLVSSGQYYQSRRLSVHTTTA